MSTVRLKKPYNGHNKGDLISVPFGKGRELTNLGIAEYPEQPKGREAEAEPDATKARVTALEAENKELKEKLTAAEKRAAQGPAAPPAR